MNPETGSIMSTTHILVYAGELAPQSFVEFAKTGIALRAFDLSTVRSFTSMYQGEWAAITSALLDYINLPERSAVLPSKDARAKMALLGHAAIIYKDVPEEADAAESATSQDPVISTINGELAHFRAKLTKVQVVRAERVKAQKSLIEGARQAVANAQDQLDRRRAEARRGDDDHTAVVDGLNGTINALERCLNSAPETSDAE